MKACIICRSNKNIKKEIVKTENGDVLALIYICDKHNSDDYILSVEHKDHTEYQRGFENGEVAMMQLLGKNLKKGEYDENSE